MRRFGFVSLSVIAMVGLAACQETGTPTADQDPAETAPTVTADTGAPETGAADMSASMPDAADTASANDWTAEEGVSFEELLQERLLDAQPGDVIDIPEGTYAMTRSLTLTVDGVTIRGAGIDKTVLNFSGQIQGAEGLLVTASDFTLEDIAFEDTEGDAVKVNEGNNIVFRRVRTEWTGGPKTENGAYGLYPVQTTNVLIEDCVAIGASDAGIYVGQSQNVIVRRNRAEYNVAGIEIENTIGADVYENEAVNNTGGILVFNMPNLPQLGRDTRVYNNRVVENNTANFAIPGTAVAGVPAGTGVIVNANDGVEIFDNDIARNATANVIVTSLFSAEYAGSEWAEGFDPYPESIYIYDNRFDGGGGNPDGMELQALRMLKYGPMGRLPDILWDGYVDEAKLVDGVLPENLRICVDNGDAEVLNIDGPNGNTSPSVDMDFHRCSIEKLAPIELPFQ